MSTQARCSPPETEPLFSGSPPRLRTLACSSLTACLHRLAACSNICFNSGLFTPAAQVRKPSSPSRLVSIKLFNVSTRSPLSIQVSSDKAPSPANTQCCYPFQQRTGTKRPACWRARLRRTAPIDSLPSARRNVPSPGSGTTTPAPICSWHCFNCASISFGPLQKFDRQRPVDIHRSPPLAGDVALAALGLDGQRGGAAG